ncbi:hypothetical protein, partial [Achromobacter xylosoxidans]|uniref:hypothetical protein n=1 Tax=Alcaligenes xylosoxydans xylosoxydans TaxID=85698 RepID=UPI001F146D6A
LTLGWGIPILVMAFESGRGWVGTGQLMPCKAVHARPFTQLKAKTPKISRFPGFSTFLPMLSV